jgi:hypothetical protein
MVPLATVTVAKAPTPLAPPTRCTFVKVPSVVRPVGFELITPKMLAEANTPLLCSDEVIVNVAAVPPAFEA